MGISYKGFDRGRTVFWMVSMLFLFVFFVFQAKAQASTNPLYRVEGVTVDVTAADSVTAQDEAFAKARMDAFNILSERLVTQGQAKAIKTPGADKISGMIEDYEVTNEQVSATRYIGTYTISFNEKAINALFDMAGVEYSDAVSGSVLVLPYIQKGGKIYIWGDENPWADAWGRTDFATAVVPVIVPLGDLADVADLGESQALEVNETALSHMLERYGASEAVIVMAIADQLSAVGDAPATGQMRVSLYSTDQGFAQHQQDLIIDADGNKTLDRIYDSAVQEVQRNLQGNWKLGEKQAKEAQKTKYEMVTNIAAAKDWVQMQQSLRSLPELSDLTVTSLRPGEARFNVTYNGDEEALRMAMGAVNLNLSAPVTEEAEVIYEVSFGGLEYHDNFYVPPQNDQENMSGEAIDADQNTTIENSNGGDKNVHEEFGVQTF